MQKAVFTPPSHAEPSTSRGRRRWVILVLILLLGAAGTAFGLTVARLHPLSIGNSQSIYGEPLGDFESPDGITFGAVGVPYNHLREYVFGTSIKNTSRFDVTITDIDKFVWGTVEAREFLVEQPTRIGTTRGIENAKAFSPVRLRPEEQVMVWVKVQFVHCAYDDSSSHITSLRFHYTTLGFRRTQSVPLYTDIVIPRFVGQIPNKECPVIRDDELVYLPGGFEVAVSLEPEYSLIFRGYAGRSRGCVITVNGEIRTRVEQLNGGSVQIGPHRFTGGNRSTVVPASAFSGPDGRWDPRRDPVESVGLACDKYADTTLADETVAVDFLTVDTRPRPLPDPKDED